MYPSDIWKHEFQVYILMSATSLNESLACYDMKVIQIPSIWLLMIAAIAPLSLLSRDGNLSFAWAWIFSPKPMIYYKSTTDCHSSLSLTCHCNVHSVQLEGLKCLVLSLFKRPWPRSPGQNFCVLELITRFLITGVYFSQ